MDDDSKSNVKLECIKQEPIAGDPSTPASGPSLPKVAYVKPNINCRETAKYCPSPTGSGAAPAKPTVGRRTSDEQLKSTDSSPWMLSTQTGYESTYAVGDQTTFSHNKLMGGRDHQPLAAYPAHSHMKPAGMAVPPQQAISLSSPLTPLSPAGPTFQGFKAAPMPPQLSPLCTAADLSRMPSSASGYQYVAVASQSVASQPVAPQLAPPSPAIHQPQHQQHQQQHQQQQHRPMHIIRQVSDPVPGLSPNHCYAMVRVSQSDGHSTEVPSHMMPNATVPACSSAAALSGALSGALSTSAGWSGFAGAPPTPGPPVAGLSMQMSPAGNLLIPGAVGPGQPYRMPSQQLTSTGNGAGSAMLEHRLALAPGHKMLAVGCSPVATTNLMPVAPNVAQKRKKFYEHPPIPDKVYPKPAYSYSCLIALALKNSKVGSLPVNEIYKFMTDHFPYFRTAPDGWKNSVRHNLSLNKAFEKVENPNVKGQQKKGCLWALNPAKVRKMEEEINKWRKKDLRSIEESMAAPHRLVEIERGNFTWRDLAGSLADKLYDMEPTSAMTNGAGPAERPLAGAERAATSPSSSVGDVPDSATMASGDTDPLSDIEMHSNSPARAADNGLDSNAGSAVADNGFFDDVDLAAGSCLAHSTPLLRKPSVSSLPGINELTRERLPSSSSVGSSGRSQTSSKQKQLFVDAPPLSVQPACSAPLSAVASSTSTANEPQRSFSVQSLETCSMGTLSPFAKNDTLSPIESATTNLISPVMPSNVLATSSNGRQLSAGAAVGRSSTLYRPTSRSFSTGLGPSLSLSAPSSSTNTPSTDSGMCVDDDLLASSGFSNTSVGTPARPPVGLAFAQQPAPSSAYGPCRQGGPSANEANPLFGGQPSLTNAALSGDLWDDEDMEFGSLHPVGGDLLNTSNVSLETLLNSSALSVSNLLHPSDGLPTLSSGATLELPVVCRPGGAGGGAGDDATRWAVKGPADITLNSLLRSSNGHDSGSDTMSTPRQKMSCELAGDGLDSALTGTAADGSNGNSCVRHSSESLSLNLRLIEADLDLASQVNRAVPSISTPPPSHTPSRHGSAEHAVHAGHSGAVSQLSPPVKMELFDSN